MIDQLLRQLRDTVNAADGLSEETKVSLLNQLEGLKTQIFPETKEEELDALPPAENSGLHKLVASVEELEASHPDITVLITRLATVLGNSGV